MFFDGDGSSFCVFLCSNGALLSGPIYFDKTHLFKDARVSVLSETERQGMGTRLIIYFCTFLGTSRCLDIFYLSF